MRGVFFGDRDRPLAAAQSLVGIAEVPKDPSEEGDRKGSAVEPAAGGRRATPLRIVERHRPFQMGARGDQVPYPKQVVAKREISIGKQFRMSQAFGHTQQLLTE